MMKLPSTTLSLAMIAGSVMAQDSFTNSTRTATNFESFPTINCGSDNGGYGYYANLSVGNPAQDMALRIDIAQPYVWLLNSSNPNFPPVADYNPSVNMDKTFYNTFTVTTSTVDTSETLTVTETYVSSATYATLGSYDYDKSKTGKLIKDSYALYSFLDYIWINGTVVEDDMTIDFVTFDNSTKNHTITLNETAFINANGSDLPAGALGLAASLPGEVEYNYHFLDNLVENGIINSSSFSFHIQDNSSAKLILGGVDQDYYTGPLVKFDKSPYLSSSGDLKFNYPIVPLTSINVKNLDSGDTLFLTADNSTFPVLLDSRVFYIYLPEEIIIDIAVQLNAFYYSNNNWLAKCSIQDLAATIGFQFGNITIDLPIADLLSPIYYNSTNRLVFDDGEEACLLLTFPNTEYGYSILGTTFLKSAYLVVDNEGDTIALAQANKNVTKKAQVSTYVNGSLSTASTIPFESSIIRSGDIPFAVTNNITDSITYIYETTTFDSYFPGVATAVVTNGEIFTGRIAVNTTSNASSWSSASKSKSFGTKLSVPSTFTSSSFNLVMFSTIALTSVFVLLVL